MSEEKNVVHLGTALDLQGMEDRRRELQEMLQKIFKKDIDYGYLPGAEAKKKKEDEDFQAGKRKTKSAIKPMLLKPGVEKINTRYGLFPFYIQLPTVNLDGDHREERLICELRTINGTPIAQGVGSCSSYESKYRYRWENTGKAVPTEYWEGRDPELLGGRRFAPRKIYDEKENKTAWFIFEKIGVADPADVWNTIFKMAAKRAKSDATFSATAAGDIFDTEDLDDPDLIPPKDKKTDADNPYKGKEAPVKTDGKKKEKATDEKLIEFETEMLKFFSGSNDMVAEWLESQTPKKPISSVHEITTVGQLNYLKGSFRKQKDESSI